MIEQLHIRALGIVEDSTLELGPGLSVVTGETGAGKTMLVTALGLLLGARGDSGLVGPGASLARVDGVVDVAAVPAVAERVAEVGGVVEDGALVLARTVSSEGRSRAHVGGAAAPVGLLAELAEHLVVVHGQSDQQRLTTAKAQREALDRFGGAAVTDALAAYRVVFDELTAVERELGDVQTGTRERLTEAEFLRFGLAEIDAVNPVPGEEEALAAEETRLGAADELRLAIDAAHAALSDDDGTGDAASAVANARRAVESVAALDPDLAAMGRRIAEIGYQVTELATDLAAHAAGLETDPLALATVSERRSRVTALLRKYGDTTTEVLAWAEASRAKLDDLEGSDERLAELRTRRQQLRADLVSRGQELTRARSRAAEELAVAVGAELHGLAMPDATLLVQVGQRVVPAPATAQDEEALRAPVRVGEQWQRYGSSGFDEVELLLAANRGGTPRPLGRAASGGELSRVMLALEVSLAASSAVPTFVFDEIDAGVGGAVAVEVGRRLAVLARHAQVLVVTHLPQVAAFADRHVVVRKQANGQVTTSGLSVLDDAGRERELSRMLAGLEASDTALAHARELLAVANAARSLGG